jgi:hypothetical protein
MSEEKTDGQAAFEAWEALLIEPAVARMTWDSLTGDEDAEAYRAAWEAAAAAGSARAYERTAELTAEVNELRRRLGGLLTILREGDEDDETVRRRAIDHVQRMLAGTPAAHERTAVLLTQAHAETRSFLARMDALARELEALSAAHAPGVRSETEAAVAKRLRAITCTDPAIDPPPFNPDPDLIGGIEDGQP